MPAFEFHNLAEMDKVHMRSCPCSLFELGGSHMSISFISISPYVLNFTKIRVVSSDTLSVSLAILLLESGTFSISFVEVDSTVFICMKGDKLVVLQTSMRHLAVILQPLN